MACKSLIIAIFAPLAVACAPFAASSAPALTPEQVSLVQATCDRVMGLAHSGVYRDLCRESLSKSLAREEDGEVMAASYSDCDHEGLKEGSAAFSTCVLDDQSRPHTVATLATHLAYDANTPENAKGYFDVDDMEHWRRERYSCAQLGLMPRTGAFGQCVASLEGVLQPDPN
jgi:hypothetical protein